MPASVGDLTVNDFEAHKGDEFRLLASPELTLKLAQILRKGQGLRAGGAFSLLFVAPKGPYAPQNVYPLSHPTLGTFELFVVPIGPLEGGNGYEVVFT
jgi:uncharacterized protein DUF6916